MSANFTQIISNIDRNCKTTNNPTAYPLAEKVADMNLALDKAWAIILQSSGTWQLDDSNQTDYPIITTNLVSGQRDYSFTVDGSGNLILDIYKVLIANTSGVYHEIYPVDVQSEWPMQGFTSGQNITGQPSRYDKTGNGIFLDAIPNYNSTGGLKIYINREASYFTVSDTTKKPGFAGIFHEYLALRPSYQYAYRNSLNNAQALQNEMLLMEDAMQEYYSKRSKDERTQIRMVHYRSSR